jgi:hypothetical protein
MRRQEGSYKPPIKSLTVAIQLLGVRKKCTAEEPMADLISRGPTKGIREQSGSAKLLHAGTVP